MMYAKPAYYFLGIIDIHGVEKKGFGQHSLFVATTLWCIKHFMLVWLRSKFATLTYKYQVSALDFVDKDIMYDGLFKKRIEQSI